MQKQKAIAIVAGIIFCGMLLYFSTAWCWQSAPIDSSVVIMENALKVTGGEVIKCQIDGWARDTDISLAFHIEAGKKHQQNLVKWQDKANEVLNTVNKSYSTNTCLTARINGKLKTSEENKIVDSVLAELGVKSANIVTGDNYISVTGYTPLISSYLQVKGQKVNVQLVVRRSSYDDGTYVIIGCPIITQDF